MGREKNLFSDTCEASCLAAASLCAEESAAYVRDVYRLPSTYVREAVSLARSATSWQLAVASYLAFVVLRAHGRMLVWLGLTLVVFAMQGLYALWLLAMVTISISLASAAATRIG